MTIVTRGSKVLARSASGRQLEKRALTGVTMGSDFEVVWVVRPDEWDLAIAENREPEAVPWPAEDVLPV